MEHFLRLHVIKIHRILGQGSALHTGELPGPTPITEAPGLALLPDEAGPVWIWGKR